MAIHFGKSTVGKYKASALLFLLQFFLVLPLTGTNYKSQNSWWAQVWPQNLSQEISSCTFYQQMGFVWNRKGTCQPWVSEGEETRHLTLSTVCEYFHQISVTKQWREWGVNSFVWYVRTVRIWPQFLPLINSLRLLRQTFLLASIYLVFPFLGPLFIVSSTWNTLSPVHPILTIN